MADETVKSQYLLTRFTDFDEISHGFTSVVRTLRPR